ncbi:response regulator [uncultured Psychroserpens sp.]|uniref:response regulator transcription factor n=1 Tax=uncultured Psychroserpens sp. TaxID=255436 RepID=UPI00261FA9D1|nr:response regulator [uncultured Psychroserpens sp.]
MKAHILIVEDEALLYKNLCNVLEKENYSVDKFTPSVEEALSRINMKRPDLILLDIQLEGQLSGLDLGEILNTNYHIPFIYITGLDDDQTFYEGLNTEHELFIVKTKPRLNPKDIIRAVQTILKKKETKIAQLKNGVMGLVMYLDEMKETGSEKITKVPIKFSDIGYFTVKPFINDNGEVEELKSNYVWFLTQKKEHFFIRSSLSEILSVVPHYFVRINESYIVNITPNILTGNINNSRISILNQTLTISNRYKKEVKRRFEAFYK